MRGQPGGGYLPAQAPPAVGVQCWRLRQTPAACAACGCGHRAALGCRAAPCSSCRALPPSRQICSSGQQTSPKMKSRPVAVLRHRDAQTFSRALPGRAPCGVTVGNTLTAQDMPACRSPTPAQNRSRWVRLTPQPRWHIPRRRYRAVH
jgi:hypothetical protein